jgi:hypothetical protein
MTLFNSWSKPLIGLGLAFVVAALALPQFHTQAPMPPAQAPSLVQVSARWFGQVPLSPARPAAHAPKAVFWLGDPKQCLVPLSSWQVIELSDGSARMSCLLAESRDESRRWFFEATLRGRDDSAGWQCWRGLRGTLRGQGAYAGALLELHPSTEPAARLGCVPEATESDPNVEGRFSFQVIDQPDDGSALVFEDNHGGWYARLTARDVSHTDHVPQSGVLSLPGIGEPLVFVSGGQFEELSDGSARLAGVVARHDERSVTFALEISLGQFATDGETACPPSDSPWRALASDAYADGSGTLDDSTWRYYSSLSGTLTGLGSEAGALIQLERSGPAFQVGIGANGRSTSFGASGAVTARVLSQPDSAARFPETSSGELCLELHRSSLQITSGAREGAGKSLGFEFPGLGDDFVFSRGGQLVEQPAGTAHLTGEIMSLSRPDQRLFVDIAFAGRCGGHNVSRELEFPESRGLFAASYIDQGGPVDPGTWHAYRQVQGTLWGLGSLSSERFDVTGEGMALQVGIGANGSSLAYGAWGEFLASRVTQSLSNAEPVTVTMSVELRGSGREALSAAGHDLALAGSNRAGALRIDGLGGDFVFVSGGELLQRADGSASLSGILARRSYPLQRFLFEAELQGRRDPQGASYPPQGSPKLGFVGEPAGSSDAPARHESWTYYESFEGRLLGLEEFSGARIALQRRGPAFQVGLGASGRNADYGAAGWITLTVEQAPKQAGAFAKALSTGMLTLESRRDLSSRAEEAVALTSVKVPAGHALSLPGLATDLIFADGGEYCEYSDGRASLTGIVSRATDSGKSFSVQFDFDQRVDPDFGNYPPQGSPSLELPRSAYSGHGGVVDPHSWHYFESIEGVLVGMGEWSGSWLKVQGLGQATQVGHGANGRNLEQGASALLDVEVIHSPGHAEDWPQGNLQGRLDIDLERFSF